MRKHRISLVESDIWPGFTDVISSMILVLIFVLTVYAVMQAELTNILGGKQQAIMRLETQLAELRDLFGRTKARSEELEDKVQALAAQLALSEEERRKAEASGTLYSEELAASQADVDRLAETIETYIAQIKDLSARLQRTEGERDQKAVEARDLMARIRELQQAMARLQGELSQAEEQLADKGLTVADLLLKLDKKQKEVDELRRMERFRSEFLASLRDIFEGNPNIQIAGDRFIFQAEVLFASGSDRINEEGKQELLKFVAAFEKFKVRLPRRIEFNIQVQGHTDTDQVINTARFASNWELSTARATQVVKYFISQGIPPQLLSASGYGEYYPRVEGDTPEAKRANRRIEIKLTTP